MARLGHDAAPDTDQETAVTTTPPDRVDDDEAPRYSLSPLGERFADVDNRFRYHPPTPEAVQQHEALRAQHRALAHLILEITPEGRHQSLALTALQESLMWANAAVACDTPRPA